MRCLTMVAVKSFTSCLPILALAALLFSAPAQGQSAPEGMEAAPGLRVTTDAMVWILESPDATPALHSLARNNAAVADPPKRAAFSAAAKSLPGATIRGSRAAVRIHAGAAAFYVQYSRAEDDENHKPPPSAALVFSIIRLRPAQGNRIVAWYDRPGAGKATLRASVVESTAVPSDDFTWLKITPAKPLPPGEYGIVQLIPAYNTLSTWIFDFGVD